MTTKITTYLCIGCPLGCRLEVEEDQGAIVEIRGFDCKRGKEYAQQEHTDPRRMVTTTVHVEHGLWSRLPVKTAEAVTKHLLRTVCEALRGVIVTAPIEMGEVIVSDIMNTGIDVLATRDMPVG